jgi:porphobilinogen synthase
MPYPYQRPRRLRRTDALRRMLRETHLRPEDLILPLFVTEGEEIREPITSMPGYERLSIDLLCREAEKAFGWGIRAALLFARVEEAQKDNTGKHALNPSGLLPRAIAQLKRSVPEMMVMSDVALDPYSSYGHDGLVIDKEIANDPTVEILSEMALIHARSGVDFVAPSDMMDGRIGAIRRKLEEHRLVHTGIMAYSAKYASAFYGPFRDALESAPGFGDKQSYQMDPANSDEALKEAALDLDEGADILMVKPGLPYLDIVRRLKETYQVPIAAYHVSGEYAMLKAAAQQGWLDEQACAYESLLSLKRAGADLIATYFARNIAQMLA